MFQRSLPPPNPPFERIDDRGLFTRTLINSGYRAYELTVTLDNPQNEEKVYTVWAKPPVTVTTWKTKASKRRRWDDPDTETQPETQAALPDLAVFAAGRVLPLRMSGRVVKSTDVIILAEEDGGRIVTGYDRKIL